MHESVANLPVMVGMSYLSASNSRRFAFSQETLNSGNEGNMKLRASSQAWGSSSCKGITM